MSSCQSLVRARPPLKTNDLSNMSVLKRYRGRGEHSYCEDASPAFKRLRLEERDLQEQPVYGPSFNEQQQQAQQQHSRPCEPVELPGLAFQAVPCDEGDYAGINSLLKQLHDERMQRSVACAPAPEQPHGSR